MNNGIELINQDILDGLDLEDLEYLWDENEIEHRRV